MVERTEKALWAALYLQTMATVALLMSEAVGNVETATALVIPIGLLAGFSIGWRMHRSSTLEAGE